MIRIAVDAMGGDHAPAAVVDGAVAAARHLAIQMALVGSDACARGGSLCLHADWRDLGVSIVEAPDVIGWPTPRGDAAARAARVDPGGGGSGRAPRGRRALQRRQHRCDGDGTHAAFGHDSRRRSSCPGDHHSHAARPAVLLDSGANVECRPAASAAVRNHGQRLRAAGARRGASARRPAVDWRGRDARATS